MYAFQRVPESDRPKVRDMLAAMDWDGLITLFSAHKVYGGKICGSCLPVLIEMAEEAIKSWDDDEQA